MSHSLKQGKPAIWEKVVAQIPAVEKFRERIWMTYGKEIWSESLIPQEILEHELIHVRQQTKDMDKDEWWDKWLNDLEFRYKMELEGYKRQIEYVSTKVKDRNKMFQYKVDIAKILSGRLYGNIKSYSQAMHDLSYPND